MKEVLFHITSLRGKLSHELESTASSHCVTSGSLITVKSHGNKKLNLILYLTISKPTTRFLRENLSLPLTGSENGDSSILLVKELECRGMSNSSLRHYPIPSFTKLTTQLPTNSKAGCSTDLSLARQEFLPVH